MIHIHNARNMKTNVHEDKLAIQDFIRNSEEPNYIVIITSSEVIIS